MIIEGDVNDDIEVLSRIVNQLRLEQQGDYVMLDKQQARQLIEVLQKWLDGEEVE